MSSPPQLLVAMGSTGKEVYFVFMNFDPEYDRLKNNRSKQGGHELDLYLNNKHDLLLKKLLQPNTYKKTYSLAIVDGFAVQMTKDQSVVDSSPPIVVTNTTPKSLPPLHCSLRKPSINPTMTPFTAVIIVAFTLFLTLPSDARILTANDRAAVDLRFDSLSGRRFPIPTVDIPRDTPLSRDRFTHLRIRRPIGDHGPLLVMRPHGPHRGCRHGMSAIESYRKPIFKPYMLSRDGGVTAMPLPVVETKKWEPEKVHGLVKWFRDAIDRY
ncbi:hypothetical protein J5N97_007681 [Dioscorea zingiberensis]|uniref:Uncharacterized protein n=1 Tax=Dioscorea zingiberensis TaxID=325984 RepID=A0A9D5HTW7_9LILI|nr:hypothetical protein J5N97_007681 [Dioscorea zingiberensis]